MAVTRCLSREGALAKGACLCSVLWLALCGGCERTAPTDPAVVLASSETLKDTVVLHVADEAITPGKSALWCASFQLAWHQLQDGVVKQPIMIKGAEDISRRLNDAPVSLEDLVPGSYYATAGTICDGVLGRIEREMRGRALDVQAFKGGESDSGLVAYSWLRAEAKFAVPFFDNPDALVFENSLGQRTRVHSFGLLEKHVGGCGKLREEVIVLLGGGMRHPPGGKSEFAIDPCWTSSPWQLVLACVKRQGSLEETIAYVEKQSHAPDGREFGEPLGTNDIVAIPNMRLEVLHHFRELEGPEKTLLSAGLEQMWIQHAVQVIQWRLDRGGAELSSEAAVVMKSGPSYYVFNRPFLVYMKKRGTSKPFFAVWVDSPDLLCPFDKGK